MSVERFVLDELPPTPWKNGLGSTREILTWPLGADFDTFLWRVSVASIDADAAFSAFPGVDRTIMLLGGDGIHLRGGQVDQRIDQPYHPFAFSGDEPLHCELLGAASTDFNVMTRRGRAYADLTLPTTPTTISAAHGVIVGLRGDWQLDDTRLPAGTGVSWAGSTRAWQLAPEPHPANGGDHAAAVAVTFHLVR